jgi:hypothetical protein
MAASLVCVKGPYVGQEFPIPAQGLVIGRDSASANIVVNSDLVSRSHVKVSAEPDGRIIIEDLGSTNGTYLGNKKLAGRTAVANGQSFSVGGEDIVFSVSSAPSAPSASNVSSVSVEGGAKMFCTKCGSNMSENAQVCPSCGAPVKKTGGVPKFLDGATVWMVAAKVLVLLIFILCVLSALGALLGIGDLMRYLSFEYRLKLSAGVFIGGLFFASLLMVFLDMAQDIRETKNLLKR